jgi:hypothetical protein
LRDGPRGGEGRGEDEKFSVLAAAAFASDDEWDGDVSFFGEGDEEMDEEDSDS